MDGEANLPAPTLTSRPNLLRPINLDSNSNSSSSSSFAKSSEPDFLRNVQAAFKRHRPLGTMQSNKFLPRRSVAPVRETSSNSGLSSSLTVETKRPTIAETQEDASITPPSISGTLTSAFDEKYNPFGVHGNQDQSPSDNKDVNINVLSHGEPKHVPGVEGSKKVQFSVATSAISQGAGDRMATRTGDLSSHMDSLALTEMEWEAVNQAEQLKAVLNEQKHHNPVSTDGDCGSSVGGSALAVRMSALQDQLHHFRDFLHNDVNHPITQSSIVGSSCATTTSVHATSAPLLNSTTHCSRYHQDRLPMGSTTDGNMNSHNVVPGNAVQQACATVLSGAAISDKAVSEAQASSTSRAEVKEIQRGNAIQQSQVSKDPSHCQDRPMQEKGNGTNALNNQQPSPSLKNPSSDPKIEPAKSEKQEKPPSRKKGYDPDLFFKVNGKLYQRLGKIGSGGSSEVHKVISSDCTIYALKKIKLKGRDYATAYGFCQEILYLKKLKGKNNIIQLIDFEVTDKALLHEVMNGSTDNKDNKVKDDGYIYMVLEYGEIDLAHMLSQKWREIEGSDAIIDENWLRFYWQQILQAVNTIHEERIVHSDLKPANFLLVKGSLKLIDFGIAKAIMSDTTNIQRDAQVGTLSYMSPEAFMCNESDANGNVIKCGRPSDIWSLGCILYQMVYGRTPFSEYKTFWAKFKVITDPNHEIKYEPLSNPWLLDLMKKCLAWDRNQRWRIPQLLEHPFLMPPVARQIASPPAEGQNCSKAVQLIAELCGNNPKTVTLCAELQQLLGDQTALTRDDQCRLLAQISGICQKLQEEITKTG